MGEVGSPADIFDIDRRRTTTSMGISTDVEALVVSSGQRDRAGDLPRILMKV